MLRKALALDRAELLVPTLDRFATIVRKNAERAQQASQFAVKTRAVADRGGEVVNRAMGAMARIEESSREISDIINLIDEIARQTNLLALNAAVEARGPARLVAGSPWSRPR